MAHQLGRTELEKLAPPERILFWQNRIEFWQKEMVGPPSKMPQERLCVKIPRKYVDSSICCVCCCCVVDNDDIRRLLVPLC